MTDFEPRTDNPDRIDDDDTPVASTARSRDLAIRKRRKRVLAVAVVAVGLILYGAGLPLSRVLVAIGLGYVILVLGLAVLGSFARPIPEAPPPGELRRVKLRYRCSLCGAELRMTLANDQIPEPPRHCSDDMELMTALEDI